MLPPIQVRNLQRTHQLNRPRLQSFAEKALRACEGVSQNKRHRPEVTEEILVLLISDRRITQLHEQFLHQSGATDVITFQHGEIFISVPTAFRQARQFGTTLLQEIQLYIVHGLLHLHGFDDRTDRDRRKMRAAESVVLCCVRGLK